MKHNGGFGHHEWDDSPLSHGQGHGGRPEDQTPLASVLGGLALQTGLWASICLFLASIAPAPLIAPFLQQTLLMAAFAVSMFALLKGETVSLAQFNRQDVALALVALSLIAGLFVDQAAAQAYVHAHAALQGAHDTATHAAAAHAATAAHSAAAHGAAVQAGTGASAVGSH